MIKRTLPEWGKGEVQDDGFSSPALLLDVTTSNFFKILKHLQDNYSLQSIPLLILQTL